MLKRWFIAAAIFSSFVGCGESDTAPVAQFAVVGNSVSETGIATLDASGSYDANGEITAYAWSFGDGNTSTGQLVSHTYSQSGMYVVELTVTDNDGNSASISTSVSVHIENRPPTATILADQLQGTAPLTVNFSAENAYDSDGELVKHLWQMDGATLSESSVLSHTFTAPGLYTVTLTVTDDDGAEATDEEQIRVAAEGARFSLSGTLRPSNYIDVDGDVNDPYATLFDNGGRSEEQVQPIDVPVLLQGYVTEFATLGENDTFSLKNDIMDYYSVNLKAGDFVSLRITEHEFADLDLYLVDAETSEVLTYSDSYDEFESVQAARDGRFLVLVRGVTGSSKYLLKVGRTSLSPLGQSQGYSADFAPSQLIIQTDGKQKQKTLTKTQLSIARGEPERTALAKINWLNPQTRSQLNVQAMDQSFSRILTQGNPVAAEKLRTLAAMKHLRGQSDIRAVEPNYRVRPLLSPNDPAFPFQWNYPAVNLPQAWDMTTGSADVIVAVVDTGIYADHPDLEGQLVTGYDFVSDPDMSLDGDGIDADPNDPGDSLIGDSSWHGTHVSGIVAAQMNNAIGGAGVAPNTKVMPLRAIGLGGGYTYDIFQAIRYAAQLENDSGSLPDRAADIINLSLGGGGYNAIGQELMQQVRNKGIVVVAAAGNTNTSEAIFPASYDGVISVSATDFHGQRAPYSNYGEYVDLAAPGGNMERDEDGDGYTDGILSTAAEHDGETRHPSYIHYQGTSMSAPLVSGVIALMKSMYPEITPEELDSLIASGLITQDRGFAGRDNLYGHGILDAFLAVNAADGLARGEETAAIVTNAYSLVFDHTLSELNLSLTALGSAPISLSDIQISEPWLNVQATEVDNNGLGAYTVTADRDGLSDGMYTATIDLYSSTGQHIPVQVYLQVGERREQGDAGHLYIFLIDQNTMNTEYIQDAAAENGQYDFEFNDIPAGTYFVIAGSDIDNDGYICTLGEACGFYPTISKMGEIGLFQDRTDIDFTVGLSSELVTPMTVSSQEKTTTWPIMISRW